MFHLFKKIYLCRDTVLVKNDDWGVISKEKGLPFNPMMRHYFRGKQLFYYQGLEDLGIDGFVELLAQHQHHDDRLYIYCDEQAYYHLIAFWLVNLIPGCPEGTRRAMMRTVPINDHVMGNRPEDFPEMPSLGRTYEEELAEILAECEPHPDCQAIIEAHWPKLSFEFRVLHYRITGKLTQGLRGATSQFVDRFFNTLAQDVQNHLISNFYSQTQAEHFGYDPTELPFGGDPLTHIPGMTSLRRSKLNAHVNTIRTMSLEQQRQLIKELKAFFRDYRRVPKEDIDRIFGLYRIIDQDYRKLSRDNIDRYLDVVYRYNGGFNGIPANDFRNINQSLLRLVLDLDQTSLVQITMVSEPPQPEGE